MINKCLLILCLFIFISCDDPNCVNETNHVFWNSKKIQYDAGVVEKEYKGHSYLFFKQGYRMGVVHNPDCQCFKKDNINDTRRIN